MPRALPSGGGSSRRLVNEVSIATGRSGDSWAMPTESKAELLPGLLSGALDETSQEQLLPPGLLGFTVMTTVELPLPDLVVGPQLTLVAVNEQTLKAPR